MHTYTCIIHTYSSIYHFKSQYYNCLIAYSIVYEEFWQQESKLVQINTSFRWLNGIQNWGILFQRLNDSSLYYNWPTDPKNSSNNLII